jgi:hypothetical protein
MMRKGAIALMLMLVMVGVSFVSLMNGSDPGTDVYGAPTKATGPSQRMDDYTSIVHTTWNDKDYSKPWNQRWHNWSNYLPYYEQREFWLRCKNVSIYEPPNEVTWLDDVNFTTNGEEPMMAKEDLNETRKYDKPMNFTYPRKDKQLTAQYDKAMNDIGVLNFTINPLGVIPQLGFQNPLMGALKELNVEVWIDTGKGADGTGTVYNFETGEGTIEGVMKFDFDWWNSPFDPTDLTSVDPHITNNSEFYKTGRQMEEAADAIGYWTDIDDDGHPNIPGDIVGGRIWVLVYRTDNNPDDVDGVNPTNGQFWPAWRTPDLYLYCGYNEKLSWLTLPYKHPNQRPESVVGDDLGFPVNRDNFLRDKSDPYHEDPVFDDEHPQIKEGEIIPLEGWRSYDPQDDIGRDKIGYGSPDWIGPDEGEDNANIDDGFPEGQDALGDIGERDNLKYKWSATTELEGAKYNIQISSNWDTTPILDWKVRLPQMNSSLGAEDQWMVLKVTLTVLDKDRLQDTDYFEMLAYKSQNKPRVSISVTPQIPDIEGLKKAGIDVTALEGQAWILPEQEITFDGYAYDPDPNSLLTYVWDFIGPYGTKTVTDAPSVTEYFDEAGDWQVSLTVYDGEIDNINTLSGVATVSVHVTDNMLPVPMIRARLGQGAWQNTSIEVAKGRLVTFNGSDSYDPDIFVNEDLYIGMPGFDEDGNKVPEMSMKYQWDWGDGSRTEGFSPNPQAEHAWIERGARQWNREYWPVTLKIWDGGSDTVDSTAYKVYVNMPPTAKVDFSIPEGVEEIETGMEVTFSGIRSYDPNDDPNYDGKRDPKYEDRLMYTYDFGDGTPQKTGGSTYTHVYKNANKYTVRLSVSDGIHSATDQIQIQIVPANMPPVGIVKIEAESWISQEPARVYTLVPIAFDASGSYDPDGLNYLDDKLETRPIDDLKSLMWNLGDGNQTSNNKVTHTYKNLGIYTITINMTDFKGASWSNEYQIEVVNRLPVAIAKIDTITLEFDQQPVLLSAEGSFDPDGTIIGYFWEFGDDTFSDKTLGIDGFVPGVVVNHQYAKTGKYEAKLYVMDNVQGRSSEFAKVTVVIISGPEPGPTPIGDEVIFGGIVATVLVLGILSALGYAQMRKRL